MKEIIEKENLGIEDMIYEVRGVEVMLDCDIANLYHVDTKRINESVKNNPDKFPERFSFVLLESEYDDLRSKFSTAKISSKSRYNPRVFTEQGLYMLATILKSSVATQVSIAIMDTFVKMRHYINYNKNLLPHKFMLLEDKVNNNTERINKLFDKFNPKVIVKDYLFFQGDFYDAYSLIIDILNCANGDIIIIDNYIGKGLFDILRKIDKNITIITQEVDEILMDKYSKQYKNITFKISNLFHDRFIIIDRYRLFSCGASLKDLGKKCFVVTEIFSKSILNEILNEIDNNI